MKKLMLGMVILLSACVENSSETAVVAAPQPKVCSAHDMMVPAMMRKDCSTADFFYTQKQAAVSGGAAVVSAGKVGAALAAEGATAAAPSLVDAVPGGEITKAIVKAVLN